MKVDHQSQKDMVVACELPAVHDRRGEAIEYYFDFDFDGVHNQRGSPSDPIVVPLASGPGEGPSTKPSRDR